MNTQEHKFDRMTPELDAYLNCNDPHPKYKYPRDDDDGGLTGGPTPESVKAVDAWRARMDALRGKIQPGLFDAYYESKKVWLCRDEAQDGDPTEHTSPSGVYRLVVTAHGTGGGTWNYSKCKVYKGTDLIETVYRNYGSFPFSWVEGHSITGHDYLICGSDYQSQTVVELNTGERADTPKGASGFCWVCHHPNPDGTMIAVEGCFWGGPDETLIVDFSDPMSLPHLVIHTDDEGGFEAWVSDTDCRIGTEREYVDLPGHALHGKSENDLFRENHDEDYFDEIENEAKRRGLENEGWTERMETHPWKKRPYPEMFLDWFTYWVKHWRKDAKWIKHDQFNLWLKRCDGSGPILEILGDDTADFEWALKTIQGGE